MNFHVAIQEVWCRIVAEFLASCKAAFQSTVNRTGVGIGAKHFISLTEITSGIKLTLSTRLDYKTII